MQTTKKQSFVLVALGSLLLVSGCSGPSSQSVSAAPATTAPPSAQATNSPQSEKPFNVSGPLIVEHQLDVLAQREGVLAKLDGDVGAHVKADDLLAELDNRQLSADLEAARSRTTATESELKSWQSEAKVIQADYDRAKKMYDAQLISLEQFEHAKYREEEEEWDVKRAEQQLMAARETQHSLELELEKTRIRSPFAGLIARRYVREGQQVARGDRLFWITGEGPLRMRFTLPERFIGRLKKGQELPLTTPDLPGVNFVAKVIEISPVVDPASSAFEVMVELEGSPHALRLGMEAHVSLDTLR